MWTSREFQITLRRSYLAENKKETERRRKRETDRQREREEREK